MGIGTRGVPRKLTRELFGALADFANGVPTIDVIGVNSYCEENLLDLPGLARKFNPNRPFGICGDIGAIGFRQCTSLDAATLDSETPLGKPLGQRVLEDPAHEPCSQHRSKLRQGRIGGNFGLDQGNPVSPAFVFEHPVLCSHRSVVMK